jgi:hypothetical protein
MSRCIADPTVQADFDSPAQRQAVCYRQWEQDHKTLLWKAFDRRRLEHMAWTERRVHQALMQQIDPVFSAVRMSQNTSDLHSGVIETIQSEPIRQAMLDIYPRVGVAFAKAQYRQWKGLRIFYERKDEAAALADHWTQFMRHYVETKSGERIVGITDTTKKIVRGVLNEASDNGWGVEKTGRVMRERWRDIARLRSNTISRTEIVSASNAGDISGARSTGLDLEKSWLSTRDDRTREDHMDADGQLVGLNDPFTVGGEQLDQPGDPAGSPGNVINCRCTQTYKER